MNEKAKQLCNLINDSCTGRIRAFAKKEEIARSDEAVRQGFFDILGEEKLTWRGWRNHKNEIFTVMEEVLNVNLPLSLEGSAFYSEFVEVKNGAFGEENLFYTRDSDILVASRFSGSHWDTDRTKLRGKRAFPLRTEWLYVRVYDDLERFLKGVTSLADMMRSMQSALKRAVNDRIYAAFNYAGTYLPAKFTKTGSYDRASMAELIQRVQTASGRDVVLAGTKTALAAVAEGIDSKWISEEQKREMAENGMILRLTGLGVSAVEIPQSFAKGAFDFKVNDKMILVLPAGEKFVKLYFEGDTRALDLGFTDTHDQTVDTQIQTKVGVGCVFASMFGRYNLV